MRSSDVGVNTVAPVADEKSPGKKRKMATADDSEKETVSLTASKKRKKKISETKTEAGDGTNGVSEQQKVAPRDKKSVAQASVDCCNRCLRRIKNHRTSTKI